MKKYKIAVADSLFYKQYVGIIEAKNKDEAMELGKKLFCKEHPELSAHCIFYFFGEVLY